MHLLFTVFICLLIRCRLGEYNPAEVRSADFRNAKYSDVASPYPYGGSHFNYDVFPATSFSDHLRCPYAIHSLQGRDKLRLASIETNRGPERGEYRRGISPFSAWQLRRNHFAVAIGVAPAG